MKGVRNYANNWGKRFKSKKKMFVRGATSTKYTKAQSYAYGKRGKSYSLLATKKGTSKYYCSQLVWQAWNKQGFDLDYNGGAIVTPADLDKHAKTILY